MKCPGQDMRYWKPGDIFEAQCPKCDRKVEFFKDEVRRKCRCGHEIVNPKLDFGCAAWCPYAEQCVGVVPEEVRARQQAEQKDLLRERISLEMKKYFGTHFKQVHHALKVARYAEKILRMEGGNPLVVIGAAYLHGVGFDETEKESETVPRQVDEKGGLAVAKGILDGLDVDKEAVEEICQIIVHQRQSKPEKTLNSQILYEAEGLANIEEGGNLKDREKAKRLIAKVFKTKTGRQLAEELYPLRNEG
ncbi:MAG: HD domain-containing protein [Desulfobacterales bacterium]|nr:HD domain-containing protein [Desulfobacterales bacterium]